ncbi:MAG: hypothetical protein DI535_17745 [Citrobacter freundii]|nr:MAG: hypothetical protein DI535_17745 [Citrobacter freundii]
MLIKSFIDGPEKFFQPDRFKFGFIFFEAFHVRITCFGRTMGRFGINIFGVVCQRKMMVAYFIDHIPYTVKKAGMLFGKQ